METPLCQLSPDLRPADAHGDADISLLDRGRVVDSVAGDGDDVPQPLVVLDDDELLLGRRAGEHDLGVGEDVVPALQGAKRVAKGGCLQR